MTDAELRGWAAGQPFPDLLHMPGADVSRCVICGQPWPCPTRREEERMDCDHGADECPDKCMCPCDLCYLLRTEAYTGDAIDTRLEALMED